MAASSRQFFEVPYSPRREVSAQQVIAADQHDAFIALIEAGDADGAGDLAVAHWELARAQIENFISPESMQLPLGRVSVAS